MEIPDQYYFIKYLGLLQKNPGEFIPSLSGTAVRDLYANGCLPTPVREMATIPISRPLLTLSNTSVTVEIQCPACTFLNPSDSEHCILCQAILPCPSARSTPSLAPLPVAMTSCVSSAERRTPYPLQAASESIFISASAPPAEFSLSETAAPQQRPPPAQDRPSDIQAMEKSPSRSSPTLPPELCTQKSLRNELETLLDQSTCPICLDAPKNMVFQCGHSTCNECGPSLERCPICRKTITMRLKTYN